MRLEETLDEQLLSLGFAADPYPVYRRLREDDPVHWCKPWGQWIVTRYDDVMRVLHDPGTFSSDGWERRFMSQLPDATRNEFPHLWRHYDAPAINNSDPPVHTRLRSLIAKSFTPKVIESLRRSVVKIVSLQLKMIERRGCFDLVRDFAYPIPALVIARLFGAPAQTWPIFERCSEAIVSFVGTGWPDVSRASRADEALAAFADLLDPLLESRRQRPREDLLSLLVASQDGDKLSGDEVLAACIVLLFAGHETTANLLGNGVLALLRQRDQLELLQSDRERAPKAVEELLRYDAPVQRVRRVVMKECEVGGRTIEAGQLVMAFLGSANRDPDRFADPDRLDITRTGAPHIAFGHGIHSCIGAALTRLEAPIAITHLLDSFPALWIVEEPRFKPNITFRGVASLLLATGATEPSQNGAL